MIGQNETGLRHVAVPTNIILPTGILSVLSRNFGISYKYKQLYTIKYKNVHSLCGNMYVNENFNKANISNRYEKLQFLLIIFPVLMATKLPIQLLQNILTAPVQPKQRLSIPDLPDGTPQTYQVPLPHISQREHSSEDPPTFAVRLCRLR